MQTGHKGKSMAATKASGRPRIALGMTVSETSSQFDCRMRPLEQLADDQDEPRLYRQPNTADPRVYYERLPSEA